MLRFHTAGESHGQALIATLYGLPAGLRVDFAYVDRELKRRQGGYGRGARMKIESDVAQFISGVRHGQTIGSPITILIENRDWKNWTEAMAVEDRQENRGQQRPLKRPRPGHADLAGCLKYNFSEARYVLERASARETAARVAAGALAKLFLKEFGVEVASHVVAVGRVSLDSAGFGSSGLKSRISNSKSSGADATKPEISDSDAIVSVEAGLTRAETRTNPRTVNLGEARTRAVAAPSSAGEARAPGLALEPAMRASNWVSFEKVMALRERDEIVLNCVDPAVEESMKAEVDLAIEARDTVGGTFEVIAHRVPPGLGSCAQWDERLDGMLAQAVMSIQAVKAVEIGSGIENAASLGSRSHDEIGYSREGSRFTRKSNRAGGIEGGISNGEDIVLRGYLKPISTLRQPLESVDFETREKVKAAYERSDVCVVPAGGIAGEAMVALVLARAMLEKFGGDSLGETRRNFDAYLEQVKRF
jgi:chorismate synthase